MEVQYVTLFETTNTTEAWNSERNVCSIQPWTAWGWYFDGRRRANDNENDDTTLIVVGVDVAGLGTGNALFRAAQSRGRARQWPPKPVSGSAETAATRDANRGD